MKCENCGYYWREDGERYPRCHWSDNNGPDSLYGTPWDIAPCEEEDTSETWIDGEQW